jgi:hypothetical protein
MLSCRNYIFVDECGTPSFIDAGSSFKDRGYVAVATLVPALERARLLEILPRGSDGSLLKASSREMSPDIATTFIKQMLKTPVDLALVMLDTGSSQNEEIASRAAEIARRSRRKNRVPQINGGVLMYLLMVNAAIINAWSHSAIRHRRELKFFEVVMDDFSMTNCNRDFFRSEFQSEMVSQGVCVNSIRWEAEEQEPLLYIPDLFAGVCRRQLTHGDVGEAWDIIYAAAQSGRIGLQDGMEVPIDLNAGPEESTGV